MQGTETESERRRRLLNEVLENFDARGVGLRMAENLPHPVEPCTTAMRFVDTNDTKQPIDTEPKSQESTILCH